MNSVDILVGMAQEILDFVQGGGALQMEPVPLDTFVQEVVDFLREDFSERQIAIHTRLEYRGVVSLDKGKMRRVLVNIAGNTRDALNGRPGNFTIASRRQDDQVVLELIDDGPGIPPEILPNLFQPFVTHGKAHGTGLGLAISKKIVEDHGGTISVMTGLPQGAGFVITLPLP